MSVLAAVALMFILPVKAAYNDYVIDTQNLTYSSEQDELNMLAAEASEQHDAGIYIRVYYDYTGFNTIEEYAEYVYESEDLGYGPNKDGIMLILTMADRSFDIYAKYGGKCEEAFSDYAREQIAGTIVNDYLSDGEFYDGFKAFIDLCDSYLGYQEQGTPISPSFDPYREEQERQEQEAAENASRAAKTGATLGIPPLTALLTVLGLRSRNKTEHIATEASGYIKGTKLHRQTDRFLYRNQTVTHVQRDRDSGGGGGSFHSSSSGSGGHTSGHF